MEKEEMQKRYRGGTRWRRRKKGRSRMKNTEKGRYMRRKRGRGGGVSMGGKVYCRRRREGEGEEM